MQKDDFYVNVFSVLVEEILEKMGHGFVGDVTANDDVPKDGRESRLTLCLG